MTTVDSHASRNSHIRRIHAPPSVGSSPLGSPSASALSATQASPGMVGLSLSSPLDSTTGTKSRHQKKKDSILISSRVSAPATSDSTQQQAPEPTGMDSKRTVRKKVIIGGAASASASASAAAVAATPVVAAAAGTESVKGGALFRGSGAGTGMASERLRKAGASLTPVLGHGTGQSKTAAAAKPSPGSSGSSGGNQVGDAAMEPLTPNLVSPSTGRSGLDTDNDDDQPPSAGVRHQHQQPRRFAPRNAAAAGAAGSSPAGPAGVLRGARMDDGSGLAPEYQEQVRRNPLLWADMEFAAANGSHSDAVFTHYCSHLRSSFVGKEPRAQHMDLAALTRLANDTVERFLQRHRRHIASTNPKFGDAEVEAALLAELPHTRIGAGVPLTALAPSAAPTLGAGGLGKVEQALRGAVRSHVMDLAVLKQHVLVTLRRELDKDRDKLVSRTDFLMRWKMTVTKLQSIEKDSKDLCVIL